MNVATDGVRVTVIDVGKGDCILVQVGDAAGLIDTGYDNTAGDVVSYLRAQGVGHLDFLVVTHYDKDHVGGIQAIGEACSIDALYLPGYQGADKPYRMAMAAVKALGIAAHPVTKEQTIALDDAVLTIYPTVLSYDPDANGDEGNDNDLSLVTTLVCHEDSYLFAGDLEEEGVDAYLERALGRFDVLKVPHHGERGGNTGDLLAQVQPKIAVITDSADDPADKKTLKALKKARADTYCTSDCGTVVIASNGAGNYEVSCERD